MKDLQHLLDNPLPTDTPFFDIAHYIKHSPKIEDYDLARKFAEWRETGVVVFENAVPAEDIAAFLADVEYLALHRRKFDLEVEYQGARYGVRDVPVPPLSALGFKWRKQHAC